MTKFIGIDIGTTFIKGAVLDADRRAVTHIRRVTTPEPVPGLPATRHELDPAAVVQAVRALLTQLLTDAPDAAGLVMCSQMHGLVLCDERGNPKSNAMTWKDQRILEPSRAGPGTQFDDLQALVTHDEQDEIGRELRVGLPITTLSWLRQHDQLPPDTYPASLPDFVLANLCGVQPTTEATNAAAHGLLHLDRLDWHHNLITRLGLEALRWPRIRSFGEVVGEAQVGGRTLPCYTPVGDQQCALSGVGLQERELSLNISTGSQVSLLTMVRPRGEFQVRPYFDGMWLRTVVQIPAGRSVAVLMGLVSEIASASDCRRDAWDYVAQAVDAVPATDLEVDLGFFGAVSGGHISNIREGNLTVGHLFATAFRSMAADYVRRAATLSPSGGWDRVVFSGGLPQRFPRLRHEILAALGDPPGRLCSTEEDTLEGLMTLSLVCAGRVATVAEDVTLRERPV